MADTSSSPARHGGVDAQLCEVLDRVLHKGAVLRAEIVISVADVELLYLDARVFLSSIDTAVRAGALPASMSPGWALRPSPTPSAEPTRTPAPTSPDDPEEQDR